MLLYFSYNNTNCRCGHCIKAIINNYCFVAMSASEVLGYCVWERELTTTAPLCMR